MRSKNTIGPEIFTTALVAGLLTAFVVSLTFDLAKCIDAYNLNN